MAVSTLKELFIHEMSDIQNSEKQMTKAWPKLSRAVESPELKEALVTLLQETQSHLERIDKVVELSGIKLKRVKCAATEGLVEESKETTDEVEKGAVLDAALIASAQKVLHYQIASYGTLATFATHLGFEEAIELLNEILEGKKAADQKMTALAESGVNQDAEEEDEEEESEES